MSRWTGCASKKRFTEHEAGRIAARFGQRAYFCTWCNGWHCTKRADKHTVVRQRAPETPHIALARAERALGELLRKGVTGPLLDAARARVAELSPKR